MHKNSKSDSYAAAGVDVTAGYQVVDKIKPLVQSTYIDGVLGGIGDFGGQFAPNLTGMTRPILVSGTDGVGTKLKIAFLLDKHDTVGIDCVEIGRASCRERHYNTVGHVYFIKNNGTN